MCNQDCGKREKYLEDLSKLDGYRTSQTSEREGIYFFKLNKNFVR